MGNFIKDFKKDFNYKEFRENFKFSGHDLDIHQTVWGRKVRAVRPLLLTYIAISFTVTGLEMQAQHKFDSVELDFYLKLRNKLKPYFYKYLDLEPI